MNSLTGPQSREQSLEVSFKLKETHPGHPVLPHLGFLSMTLAKALPLSALSFPICAAQGRGLSSSTPAPGAGWLEVAGWQVGRCGRELGWFVWEPLSR